MLAGMADDPAETRDAEGAATGVPADPTNPAGTQPSDRDDEHPTRRSATNKPGDDSGKHYEPL